MQPQRHTIANAFRIATSCRFVEAPKSIHNHDSIVKDSSPIRTGITETSIVASNVLKHGAEFQITGQLT
jgi:hypothetical protein